MQSGRVIYTAEKELTMWFPSTIDVRTDVMSE